MKSQQTLQNLMSYMAPYKMRLFLATISSILNKLCDIVPEILIGIAIDIVVNQQHSITAHITGVGNPFYQLYMVAGLTAVLWIFESIFEYCYLILWRSIGQSVQHSLRIATYDHMQNADIAYFEDKKTGGLLAIINDDINQLDLFLSEGPNAIIQLVVNIIVMGLLFTYLSPTLALLNLLPIPFVMLIAFFFQKRLAHLYETVREKVERLSSHIASRLIGITTIKSYTTERYEHACLSKESLIYTDANYAAGKVNAAYIPIVRMSILCGFIMSMIVGGCYALQGTLSISFYSVLVFLTQRFLWPFTTVTTITDMYERAMACTRRIFAVLHHKKEIVNGKHNLNQSTVQGSITFKDVNFSYSNGVQIFDKFSLTIPAQKTVAFVGTTGSGKSTIIKLILRFYDATSGAILLDDNDIKDLTTDSLRQAIALVSQEVYLTDSSITNNIAYGSPDATQEEIINAAKMAEAHEFIMALPHGYNSLVGENGKNLSGGQRQRISIARAILKNPPIFIFDEATSALDNETEAAIQHSMKALAHNHTMIIIAHRLSTIRHADIIFVLEKGVIVESGTHQELLHRNDAYATLWKIQTGEIV
jgi:ATP-binding cassette subfamily B protein